MKVGRTILLTAMTGFAGLLGLCDVARAQAPVGPLSPPTTMTFSMTGAEVDLMDDRDRKRAFMTDGRKLQKSKDDRYQEIAAKWDGNRLVTEEKSPRGGKMSRTFELSPDGRQLCENLRIESSGGKHRSLDVHYVYDILAQADRK